MGLLGRGRLKPLIPFGGTSRLIDFSLENACRSGIDEVLLLSQFEERRLMDELQATWNAGGRLRVNFGPYDQAYRAMQKGSIPALLPARTWPAEKGTADALIRKQEYIFGRNWTEVLVLHADHVYRFDYGDMVRRHRASGAALTLSYQQIDLRHVSLFGMVAFDEAGNLTQFVEKPADPTSDLVFAAFCVFDAGILKRYLDELSATAWQHDISRDVIPAMLQGGERIRGYLVRSYWEDIGTLERYFQAHRALVSSASPMTLMSMPQTVQPNIGRRFVQAAPRICSSIVPDDLLLEGTLAYSTVFPGVRIEAGASVRDSVLLPGAVVREGMQVESAIVLEDGTVLQCGSQPGRNEGASR